MNMFTNLAAALYIAEYSDPRDQRDAYADVAAEVVAVRDTYSDWAGRSYAYRQFVSAAYDAAEIYGAERVRLGNALRYHISVALRAAVPYSELEPLGLSRIDSTERARIGRQGRAAELREARAHRCSA